MFDLPARPALGVSASQSDWLIPVIMVGFPDSALRFSAAQLQLAIFDTTHATATGSMPDYYAWASSGALRVRGEVVAAVVLPHPENYYTNDSYGLNALSTPNNNWGLIRDAVLAADPTVNWNRYDRDGDGFVDMLWVVHAGLGAELTGNRRNFFSNTARLGTGWSFGGVVETGDLVNGSATQKVRVDRFSVLPEVSGFEPGTLSEIGVYCHEFGHALGLPDLYDTSSLGGTANVGPGNWSLMSTGAYGGDGHSPDYPAHPGAWPSLYLGWASTARPGRDSVATLIPVVAGGQILEFSFQGEQESQHFLVESRERIGFDRNLPNSGLVLYQVDDAAIGQRLAANRVNAGPTPGLRLVEGDGDSDLRTGLNRGDANDPLPGALGVTRLDDDTNPSLRSISGALTNLAIEDIQQVSGGTRATYRVEAPGWQPTLDGLDPAYSPYPDPGRSHHAFVTPQGREHEVYSDSRSGVPQVVLRTRAFDGAWEPIEQVSSSPVGAIQPALASLPGGDLAVAWADRRSGTWQIWYRSRIRGIWSVERALTSTATAATAPALSADGKGRVFVAWLEQGQERATLKFLAFHWASPFGTAVTVSDSLDAPSAPVLASSPAGPTWLMWPDRRTGQYAIMFARFSPDSGIGPKFRYTSNVTLQQATVDVVADTDGTAHVVWQQSSPGASELHYMKRPATGLFTPRDTVLEGSAETLQNPGITMDPLGGLHVIFERGAPLGMQVRYRRYVQGRGWDFRSTNVSDPAEGSASRASVLAVSNGGVSVLYTSFAGYDFRQLSRRRRLDGGAAAGAPDPPRAWVRLAVGPNPLRAGQSLSIRGASIAPAARVELFDAAGRRLAATTAERDGGLASFDRGVTGTLPVGLYFIRAGRDAVARLVVVR
jgi:M6 family metalloprotease-like protein